VAVVKATASVGSITLPSLVKFVLPLDPDRVAGLASVSLAGGKIIAVEPDGTLSYGATIADGWSPFGLTQAHLKSVKFKMASIVDPGWGQFTKAILSANLILGSTTIPVEIDVPIGAGAWTVGIVPPGVTVNLLSDIASLLGDSSYQTALPPQLVKMTAFQVQSLILKFDPAGPSWSGIDLDLGTANAWPIAENPCGCVTRSRLCSSALRGLAAAKITC
jgi:hypothetical protein